jgi:hypothetical protein
MTENIEIMINASSQYFNQLHVTAIQMGETKLPTQPSPSCNVTHANLQVQSYFLCKAVLITSYKTRKFIYIKTNSIAFSP